MSLSNRLALAGGVIAGLLPLAAFGSVGTTAFTLVDDAGSPETFESYAQEPGAYRSDDSTVVIPEEAAPDTEGQPFATGEFTDRTLLPSHLYEDVDVPVDDAEAHEAVVADRGPAFLACTDWPGQGDCTVSVGHMEGQNFVYWMGLGTDSFQRPGSAMEVFQFPSYANGVSETLVIGGGSVSVAEATIELTDGRKVKATLAGSDVGGPNSLYFARVAGDAVRIVTRDAQGAVIESHRLRPCEAGEQCEVY